MKRIVFNKFNSEEQTTHGINKIAWEVTDDYGKKIKVNLWDFGGQHIQHSMHQFFFTERVVYVLVLNPRNDEKAAYWLEQIDKLGSNSDIIVVYNWKEKADKEANYTHNFYELQKKYGYLSHKFVISCKSNSNMDSFKAKLKEIILANEGIKDKYPLNWFEIKNTLEKNVSVGVNYINYEKYQEVCVANKYDNLDDQNGLLVTLNRIGSIVFFNKPILDQLQVLNPEWITTGVYAILTSNLTDKKKGHLNLQDLKEIFKDEKTIFSDTAIQIKYSEKHFHYIIQLMLAYDLCQENPFSKNEYLIPSAFKGQPDNDYNGHKQDSRQYRVQFESPFEMLFMHRFIAKNINKTVSEDYWQSGIYIKDINSETYALIETNLYSLRIDFWIKGNSIRGFWEALRRDLREIFSFYKKLDYREEVLYESEDENVFLPYQEMLDSLEEGVLIIPYHPTYKLRNIDVLRVIDLFEDPKKLIMENSRFRNLDYEKIKVEFNPVTNITQNVHQHNENTINTNIKIDVSKISELKDINEILLDLYESGIENKEIQETILKSLDQINRLSNADDKASQKTSISIIERYFKKLKDLKDVITIGLLPVDVTKKVPQLLELWENVKHFFH